jgi:glycosyltransferase involved in cell wall biosynthesis
MSRASTRSIGLSSVTLAIEHAMRQRFLLNMIGRAKNYRLGLLATEAKAFLLYTLPAINKRSRRVVSLKPNLPAVGHVLLGYINEGFFLKPGQPVPHSHPTYWEAPEIARTFLELGYQVDVIDENNDRFTPGKRYSLFVANRKPFDRIAPMLNRDCVKILHIDSAHWLFHDSAGYRRLQALQQRKGLVLRLRRSIQPNFAIEQADYATVLGNSFTIGTYQYANKPFYRLPVASPVLYPWMGDKDFVQSRRRFLWFGSGGLVHKGLDLVLDAFADMPDCQLTVCGPITAEQDFTNAYHKELYQTPNIRTLDWIDIASPEFLEVAKTCIALVYPSCSEGQSSSVVICLHAGLIPIISYESGVDVAGFGTILRESSIEELKVAVRTIASLPGEELARRSRLAWEYARATHTREAFAQEYRKIISTIIGMTRGVA